MIVTTTPGIDGKTIATYHGVVAGEAILGANIFRDLFAGIRDIVGGRSAAYEEELGKARRIALEELERERKIKITESWIDANHHDVEKRIEKLYRIASGTPRR